MKDVHIVEAKIEDSQKLTQISFAAKVYWQYPEEYFAIWKNELSISERYILDNKVFKAIYQNSNYENSSHGNPIIAFYSLVELSEKFPFKGDSLQVGTYLDHMFINPKFISKGLGRTTPYLMYTL